MVVVNGVPLQIEPVSWLMLLSHGVPMAGLLVTNSGHAQLEVPGQSSKSVQTKPWQRIKQLPPTAHVVVVLLVVVLVVVVIGTHGVWAVSVGHAPVPSFDGGAQSQVTPSQPSELWLQADPLHW